VAAISRADLPREPRALAPICPAAPEAEGLRPRRLVTVSAAGPPATDRGRPTPAGAHLEEPVAADLRWPTAAVAPIPVMPVAPAGVMPAGLVDKSLGPRSARRCLGSRRFAFRRPIQAIGIPRRGPKHGIRAPGRRPVRQADPVGSGGTAPWKRLASGLMVRQGTGPKAVPRTPQAPHRTARSGKDRTARRGRDRAGGPCTGQAAHQDKDPRDAPRTGRPERPPEVRTARRGRDRAGGPCTGQAAHQDKDPRDAPRTGRPERPPEVRTAYPGKDRTAYPGKDRTALPGKGRTGDPRTGLRGQGPRIDQVAAPPDPLAGRSNTGRIPLTGNRPTADRHDNGPARHLRTGSATSLAAIRAGTRPSARRGVVRGAPDRAGHVRRSMRHLAR
jgi:hypothetical protein